MIHEGYYPGKGFDVLNHSSTIQLPPVVQSNEQFLVWLQLKMTINKIIPFLSAQHVPEVGMNLAYALPNAKTLNDVCAIDGRLIKHRERISLCGTIDFGVSKHVASIVLAAMSYDITMRSAMNIRYSQEIVNLCKKIGFTLGSFDRGDEPSEVSSTMEWGTKFVITKLGEIPDVIYDKGSVGKEPMIRILGKNPEDVLLKTQKLLCISVS